MQGKLFELIQHRSTCQMYEVVSDLKNPNRLFVTVHGVIMNPLTCAWYLIGFENERLVVL